MVESGTNARGGPGFRALVASGCLSLAAAIGVRAIPCAPATLPKDVVEEGARIHEPMQFLARGARLRAPELDKWVSEPLRADFKRSRQALFLALFVLPSWMNLLIKNYAWIVILRRQGILNTLFQSLGIVSEPFPLLFNTGAVLVGLVHTYLPFMLLPIYVAIERMDFRLVEAARDLSAGPWQTFRRVVLPSTREGAVVGCTLVFVPALGAFVTPDLLGGPQSLMVGTLIENQLLQVRDWPFAAALSVSLMTVVAISLTLSRRFAPGERAASW